MSAINVGKKQSGKLLAAEETRAVLKLRRVRGLVPVLPTLPEFFGQNGCEICDSIASHLYNPIYLADF